MSSQLKEIKAKFLAEKKQLANLKGSAEPCFFRQLKESSLHPQIVKQARKSGQLNLSNRGLSEMPDIVWSLNSLTAEETKALSLSLESKEEDQWWEYVDLTKLILASNTLKTIPPTISNYPALSVLDLHDNCLCDLPSTLSDLLSLTKLNLSRNQFEIVPECIFQLKNLRILHLQHNKLRSLDDDIGNLSFLEELDISHNCLKKLPHCIGFITRVTEFNVSNNELSVLPVEVGDMHALRHLDLSKNKLKKIPDSFDMLCHLEQLYVQHNNLVSFPSLSGCVALKEIHCGFNSVESIPDELLETVQGLKILDLRDNKLTVIPDAICSLQALERLDLSNNNLSNLPYTLGTLPHLKFLALEGNPMRSIRRDIIQRGTVQLLRWLRSRIEDASVFNVTHSSEVDGSKNSGSFQIDRHTVKSTKTLSLSNQKLTSISKELLDNVTDVEINAADWSKNLLTELPDYMDTIVPKFVELNVGYNRLTCLPTCIGLAERLQYLDLRNNQLQSLPNELSGLHSLREVNISFNRFQALPSVLYGLKKLEIILASDNQIEEINVSFLSLLPVLAVLDLHNNSIKMVPPELGNMTQLRSLLLDGNLFRNPRPAILMKGTPALLDFLRDRIAQN